jgi:hypothetical protein
MVTILCYPSVQCGQDWYVLNKGDRKGPHPHPLHPRPYYDYDFRSPRCVSLQGRGIDVQTLLKQLEEEADRQKQRELVLPAVNALLVYDEIKVS